MALKVPPLKRKSLSTTLSVSITCTAARTRSTNHTAGFQRPSLAELKNYAAITCALNYDIHVADTGTLTSASGSRHTQMALRVAPTVGDNRLPKHIE
jgi:hypothetical protein